MKRRRSPIEPRTPTKRRRPTTENEATDTQASLLISESEWMECARARFGILCGPAVYLKGKVYLGGVISKPMTILCYDTKEDSWTTISSPTDKSGLTTYQGKLVAVGGMLNETDTGVTNKVWSRHDGTPPRWSNDLPSMPTPRSEASAVDTGRYLIVAGGLVSQYPEHVHLKVVEVFDGCQWTSAEPLPIISRDYLQVISNIHNGEILVMGGRSIFCAKVDSLVDSVGSSEGEGGSVWKTLPEAPLLYSSFTMYSNVLVAIGGGMETSCSPQSTIYGYITGTQSWNHIGDLPNDVSASETRSIILPSRELLVFGGRSGPDFFPGQRVFKTTLKVPSLQQLCVMTIGRNNVGLSKLSPIVQKKWWKNARNERENE